MGLGGKYFIKSFCFSVHLACFVFFHFLNLFLLNYLTKELSINYIMNYVVIS